MHRHLTFLTLLIFLLLISSVSAQEGAAESELTQPAVAWVDVRSWAEYQLDHIDGDERIDHRQIVAGISQLYPDKNTPIRLYCRSGGRAGTASSSLLDAGYTNVENVGGIEQARALRAIGLAECGDPGGDAADVRSEC